MTSSIVGETVTLIRRTRTGVDTDNNDIYTDTLTPAVGAVFTPAGSVESLNAQDQVITSASFTWINTIPDLTAVDAIQRANGDKYEINGNPDDALSPFQGSTTRVLQVRVKEVTG